MSVGLVIVSHSEKLAEGVVELAAQMARDVTLVAAGGTQVSSGGTGIGTSLERVMDALSAADTGDGVLVLTDLGSAVMTAESALEFMGNPATIALADAPLVEGAVAAAVAAQSGASLAEVRNAAEVALQPPGQGPGRADQPATETGPSGPGQTATEPESEPDAVRPDPSAKETLANRSDPNGGPITADLTLINPLGLHARPAAVLAGALGAMDVDIEINGVDGQSVMMLMTLGAGEGKELHVQASGPDAQQAVDFVSSEVEKGFGEI
ncbi:MAG TPA: dihydroxyacetone kinase phosphoryl donor subunit DhaM [Micrococcaceae bacterium]|jgi:PTS hybrid protein|nr:dihydroxyacetone kinase phosphoryl donor subunit DhaM [Micrococcaceae bacterium]